MIPFHSITSIGIVSFFFSFFFFNDSATTEIYTLSLHDALPICLSPKRSVHEARVRAVVHSRHPLKPRGAVIREGLNRDRKSTRLNSSHSQISYAVFCLKKKIALATDVQQAVVTDLLHDTGWGFE